MKEVFEEELGKRKIFIISAVVLVVIVAAAAVLMLGAPSGEEGEGGKEVIEASFTFSPTAPKVGVTVSFMDNSGGNPVEWKWDFGDGTTSTSRNSSHAYENAGTYTVTLTVTYADGTTKTTTRQVTVSEEVPLNAYIVFRDAGIVPDAPPPADIWVWSGADWGMGGPLLVNGKYVVADAPEGTEVFACTSGSGSTNYVGWGVFLGASAAEGHKWTTANSVDLSGYSKLEFWVKTPVNLKVELEELPEVSPAENPQAQGRKSPSLRISSYGWDGTDTWQKISIPRDAFRNVDMTRIRSPFMVTGEGENITFYVDDVVWIP